MSLKGTAVPPSAFPASLCLSSLLLLHIPPQSSQHRCLSHFQSLPILLFVWLFSISIVAVEKLSLRFVGQSGRGLNGQWSIQKPLRHRSKNHIGLLSKIWFIYLFIYLIVGHVSGWPPFNASTGA